VCPVVIRAIAAASIDGTVSYVDYFNRYRSPFHLTCESLVLGFTIAWLSLNTGHLRVFQRRLTREVMFWGGTAAVLSWLLPSEILGRIDTRTIVVAPAVIGLGFGAMVLAVVSGSGSFSPLFAWHGWRPVATGSYTLYLTHMLSIPVALALAEAVSGGIGPLTARWL